MSPDEVWLKVDIEFMSINYVRDMLHSISLEQFANLIIKGQISSQTIGPFDVTVNGYKYLKYELLFEGKPFMQLYLSQIGNDCATVITRDLDTPTIEEIMNTLEFSKP
jgi:hypothetical protein